MEIHFPKAYADRVQRLRVPGGFVLLAAFALLPHPDAHSLAFGIPISICGLALRAWAAGHLAKNEQLATGGPFAWIRNPLYAGTLITVLGIVIASRSWTLAAISTAVFLLIYLPVIELEEQHLRNIFPSYASYAQRVPRLLPVRKGLSSPVRFSSKLYVRNQEYKAALGYAVALGWMLVRVHLK